MGASRTLEQAGPAHPAFAALRAAADRPLITDGKGEQTWTGHDVPVAAAAVDAALPPSHNGPTSRIALCTGDRLLAVATYVAALKDRRQVVPIDVRAGPTQMQQVLRMTRPGVVIGPDPLSDVGPFHIRDDALGTEMRRWVEQKENPLRVDGPGDPEAPYLITTTSGSTGTPKAVVHSFGNLARAAGAFGKAFGFGPDDTFYNPFPFSYMAGILNGFWVPLLHGARSILAEPFSPAAAYGFWEHVVRHRATVVCFIPFAVNALVRFGHAPPPGPAASRPRLGLVATAALPDSDRVRAERLFGMPLYPSYGLSETLFVATTSPTHQPGGESVGHPLDQVQIRLEGDGELLVRTPWNHLMADGSPTPSFKWHATGDLAERRPNGDLRITGRKKDIIIRGGLNISPGQLEKAITAAGGVQECAVVGIPDPLVGELVACFLVPTGGWDDEARRRVAAAAKEVLGRTALIDRFYPVPALPRNLNGKIDKPALRALQEVTPSASSST